MVELAKVVSGRVLGIAIVVLTLATAVTMIVQAQQTAQASRCTEILTTAILARSSAGDAERMALRDLVHGYAQGGQSEVDIKARIQTYDEASERADAARRDRGRFDALEQAGCNN